MRLRHIIGIVLVVALIGGGAWFFINGTNNNAVGPGGLPLIKADTNPVKLPPDDPGGDVMPNADSTVFPAISADAKTDPSMENLKLPTVSKTSEPDFAGLKTGFAVPAAVPKTTENLFDTTTKPVAVTPEPEQPKTKSDYVSGFAPDALKDDAEKKQQSLPVAAEAIQVEKPEAAKPEVKQEDKKAEPAIAVKKIEDAKVADGKPATAEAPAPAAVEDTNPAQVMETEEKAIATPVPPVKPIPVAKPVPPIAATAKAKTEKDIVAEDIAREAHAATPVQETVKPAAPIAAPGYYMQLASTPSSTEAPKLWAKLQIKYTSALAGLKPVYQTATVPGKGEYIRVQAGPLTQDQAMSRCKQLHQIDAKGGCLVFKR